MRPGGDALDLVAAVVCCGNLGAALRWSKDWLGLAQVDAETADRLKREAARAEEERRRRADRDAVVQARDSKSVWLAAKPMTEGDPAWKYLLGRGIDLAALPAPPAAIRLHPALYNAESRRSWPTIVAAICGPDGKHIKYAPHLVAGSTGWLRHQSAVRAAEAINGWRLRRRLHSALAWRDRQALGIDAGW